MAIRDSILALDDITREEIRIPEWACPNGDGTLHDTFYVRCMTGAEQQAYYERQLAEDKRDKPASVAALLVAYTLTDDRGERIFTDDDAGPLSRKSAAVLDRIATVAQRVNRMRKEDHDAIEKN